MQLRSQGLDSRVKQNVVGIRILRDGSRRLLTISHGI